MWDTAATADFRAYERTTRRWWADWEAGRAVCRCGGELRRCRCVAHGPPMWRHHPSGYHRCGAEGAGPRAAPQPATAAAAG